MTEKTKPFTELKENTEKKEEEITKRISLTEKNKDKTKDKKFLGIKRHLFKKTKKKKEIKNNSKKNLSIMISAQYFIKKSNIKSDENICIICLEQISLEKRHYLHCGHCFHCCCINKWLNMDKNKCPICKQNIECNKTFSDYSINEEEESIVNDDFVNFNFQTDYSINFMKTYILILIIFFMFRGFCFRV